MKTTATKGPAALRAVDKMREDLAYCASLMQNHPQQFATALAADSRTLREMKSLVGDLFSLCEVIRDDEITNGEK